MGKTNTIKVRIKQLLIALAAVLVSQAGYAQNAVSGTVRDDTGIELPGASILEKGTTNGTQADFDGNYQIVISKNTKLVFSYIGYLSQEITYTGQDVINVVLVEDLNQLDEVVVIGYGTQLKEELSGSVATVDMEDLASVPQVSVDQLIQGRAAGVTVTQNSGQPGGAVSVRIRGIGTINASSEPLYIIDGVPFSNDTRNIAGSGNAIANSAGALAGINPSDIASINVLKDASATAIYGSRGANGVVIITTKAGSRTDGKVSYSSYTAIQQPTNILPVLNLQDYAAFQNEIRNVFELNPVVEFRRPDLLGPGTNWQKEIFQNALLQNHQLSFSGGNEMSRYYVSANYTDQDGTVRSSGFDRTSVRLNLDSQVMEGIKVGANITASRTNEDLVLSSDSRGTVSLALRNNPAIAVVNPDGSFAGPTTAEEISLGLPNPIAEIESVDNDLRRDRIFGNLFAEIDLSNGFSYRAEFGGNFENITNNNFQSAYSYGAINLDNPTLSKRVETNNFWIIKNLFNYNKTFDNGNSLSALLAHEAQESSWNGFVAVGDGFVGGSPETLNNANAANSTVTEFKGSTALVSYFTRLTYTMGDKYVFQGSLRADGSSMFDDGNKFGYFPSGSVSWRLSNEDFMKDFAAVQDIKLFGGYGEVGNQGIPPFSYGVRLAPVASDLGTTFRATNIGNADLTWETSKQTNLGIDFTLFSRHLKITVEVYRKVNSDFIIPVGRNLAVLGGTDNNPGSLAAPLLNIGKAENKGIDVTFNYDTLSTGNFSWNSTLTFSHNRNEVLELVDDLIIRGRASLDDTIEDITQTEVGSPIGVFYGYKVKGLFRTVDDLDNAPIQFGQSVGDASVVGRTWLGDIQFEDINGDGIIDGNDRTQIGNPNPDFTFGFQNNFSYKNFSLGIFLQGSYGNDIFNAIGRTLTASNLTYRNQSDSVLDYYRFDNPDATHPRYTSNATNNILISDRYVEDGSYLRIQNVRFGYSLNSDIFKKVGLSKVGLYGSIQNLYTFTNYSGYDPEVGALNQSPLLTGVDNGRYPSPRTYTLGLDIEF